MATTRSDLALGARVIGGGTWLFSEPQPGVTEVLDLLGFGWDPVVRHDDGSLEIAATCTIATLRALPDSPLFPLCADSLLASWKIQHIATVGGNIATALPAGPMTSLAVALDAEVVIWSADGERRMPASEFVLGVQHTALVPGEVLRSIIFPEHSLSSRQGFRRIALSPLGRTGTLVTARRETSGETVFGVTGGTPRPYVLRFASSPDSRTLADAVDGIDDWYDDAHGAPDWRRAMSLRFAEELREELS
ncbi:FAD binding domain-containing protein [Antiquaquibacter oligotrophicus]|uniref:FAD binding domain-containing protein n=1 Tax=Antiquaquibacter oligotrophicus TaxID=2880260 RepID=UPI002AC9EE48|nr:FAD binding domain-containing protein [Antiquaquibacter oligotrophicus]UDF12766.1 FAD binding domain-containing protein [Antiquaquibacter oligotrophicus]